MKTKEKFKQNKAITLIALVITIIILLILATITIVQLRNTKLLSKAKDSRNKYNQKAEEENNILDEYANKINEITSGTVKNNAADGSYDSTKGVNTPKLAKNMTPIKWSGTTEQNTTKLDSGWYNYTNKQWANAKTPDGSYWVWIPRYEYIKNDSTKTFTVKFIPTSQTTADSGYTIHPVFRSDVSAGGWDSELSGIWVAKFEAVNSSSKPLSLPNQSSWRGIQESDIFTTCKNYMADLASHQMKNTEWGAMAYLTQSQYGLNGTDIVINNNSSYYTGNGNYVANTNESTTGNVYGIYDTSGGAWEYVASYSVTKGSYSSTLPDSTDKFCIKYGAYNTGIPGDATSETSGWYGDYASWPFSSVPVWERGGTYNIGSSAGSFAFDNGNGPAYDDHRFPCGPCVLGPLWIS